MLEKAVDIEARTNLQSLSGTREINFRCLKGYRLLVKKDKDDTNWEHRDKAPKDKVKSHNFSSANQPQTQASKKDRYQKNWRGGHPATKVNTIKVVKKEIDKTMDLSHIKCYICKQKGHYANKSLKKSKN